MNGGATFRFFRLIFSILGEKEEEPDSGTDQEDDRMSVSEDPDDDEILMSVDGLSKKRDLTPDVLLVYARIGSSDRQEPLLVSPCSRAYTPNGIGKIYSKLIRKGQSPELSSQDKQAFEEAASRILAPYVGEADSWFSSHIVNRWFDHLTQQYSNVHGRKIANIHSGWKDPYIKDLTFEGSKQNDRERLRNADTIFWPIAEGGHWYLLHIDINKQKKEVEIKCLDGFNSSESHPPFLMRGKKLVEALFGENHGFKLKQQSLQIPRQHNSDDCGPVICFQGERISKGDGPYTLHSQKRCDYSQVRPKVAQVLACLPTRVFVEGYIVQGQSKRGGVKRNNTAMTESIIDLTKDEEPNPKRKKGKSPK